MGQHIGIKIGVVLVLAIVLVVLLIFLVPWNGKPTSSETTSIGKKEDDDCSSETSCTSCTSIITSGGNNCFWYAPLDEDPFCSSRACEEADGTDCESVPSECELEPKTCESCLERGTSGAWALGRCFMSCDSFAVPCYSVDQFPDLSAKEICEVVTNREKDAALCMDAKNDDCTKCTSKIKSDGNPCFGYYQEEGFSFCSHVKCGGSGVAGLTSMALVDGDAHNDKDHGDVDSCGYPLCLDTVTTCEECVEIGASWVERMDTSRSSGRCRNTCRDVAVNDVNNTDPCYSLQEYEDKDHMEICDIMRIDKVDAVLCSSQTVCSACTTTVKSNGKDRCFWYDQRENNAGFCSNFACGASSSHSDNSIFVDCGTSVCTGECENCLDGEGAWAFGTCLGSCVDIAESGCYSHENFSTTNGTTSTTTNTSSSIICDRMRMDEADASLCFSQNNCFSCTNARMSDGDYCTWYSELGFCSEHPCGMLGCGTDSCTAECESCIENNGAWAIGAWAEGSCIESCLNVADANCYSSELYPDQQAIDICNMMTIEEDLHAECATLSNCRSCTAKTKSDGTSCYWYEDLGLCDSHPCTRLGCGSMTCSSS